LAEQEQPVAADEGLEEETDEEPEEVEDMFKIGETVKMGDLVFTVTSARWDEGGEFYGPETGERWLLMDCVIENAGDKEDVISSMIMFVLYDEEHYSRDQEFLAETKGNLDGELGPGRTMRGEIAFSVEEDQSEWEFIFQPNIFGFGQAIYLITEEDVN